MSSRPLTPEGVEIHDADLQFEPLTRQTDINQRLTDSALTGIISGLNVQINSVNNTAIDIFTGHGYAPNGEYIEVDALIQAVPLADYSNGTTNLIGLMYTEIQQNPRAHETSGNAPFTQAIRSFRARVFTSGQFSGLPTTQADLTQDSQDRFLVLASVSGSGVTGTTPNNLVASTLITAASSLALATSPYTVGPLSLGANLNATGVEYTGIVPGINSTTGAPLAIPTGLGSVSLNTAAVPPTLTWTGNGDAAGTPQNITGNGSWNLVSGAPSLSKLVVNASTELFPTQVAGATYTDSINISQVLYAPDANVTPKEFSPKDLRHRRTKGNLTSATYNPHGLRPSDVANVLRVGQTVVPGDLLPDDTAHALIPRRYVKRANAGGFFTLIDMWASGPGPVFTRIYSGANGTSSEILISNNARWDGAQWNKDLSGQAASEFLTSGGGITYALRLAANNAPWNSWDRIDLANLSTNMPAGWGGVYSDGPVISGFGGDMTPALANPRFKGDVNGALAPRFLIDETKDVNGLAGMRKYAYANTGGADTSLSIEFVLGAFWDGAVWNRDAGFTGQVTRFTFSSAGVSGSDFNNKGITISTRDASVTATWNDTSDWTQQAVWAGSLSGNISSIRDGRLAFSNAGAVSNPTAVSGFTNTLMALNTPKAWGSITLTNGGAAVMNDGFNFASVGTVSGTSGYLTVNFTTAMANAAYAPFVTSGTPSVGGGTISEIANASPTTLATGSFRIYLVGYNNQPLDPQAALTGGQQLFFHVYGRQ